MNVVARFKKALASKLFIDKLVLFGSRAKGVFSENSDFDLLIVSKDFEGVPLHKRALQAYLTWSDDRPAEILCFTPEEVKTRLRNPIRGVLREAFETGIVI